MGSVKEVRSSIRLEFSSPEEALLFLRSLNPDNKPLPKGLELGMRTEGSTLLVEISCYRPLESFLSTVNDILVMVNVIKRATEAVEER